MKTEPYRCRICAAASGSAADQHHHEKLAHREEIEKMTATSYACICGRQFASEHARKIHITRSAGEHAPLDTASEPEPKDPGTGELVVEPADTEHAAEAPLDQGTYATWSAHVCLGMPDYMLELIATLAELATWQATLDDPEPLLTTLRRIKELAS